MYFFRARRLKVFFKFFLLPLLEWDETSCNPSINLMFSLRSWRYSSLAGDEDELKGTEDQVSVKSVRLGFVDRFPSQLRTVVITLETDLPAPEVPGILLPA